MRFDKSMLNKVNAVQNEKKQESLDHMVDTTDEDLVDLSVFEDSALLEDDVNMVAEYDSIYNEDSGIYNGYNEENVELKTPGKATICENVGTFHAEKGKKSLREKLVKINENNAQLLTSIEDTLLSVAKRENVTSTVLTVEADAEVFVKQYLESNDLHVTTVNPSETSEEMTVTWE